MANGLMYETVLPVLCSRGPEDLTQPDYATIATEASSEYPADVLHRLQAVGYGKVFGRGGIPCRAASGDMGRRSAHAGSIIGHRGSDGC